LSTHDLETGVGNDDTTFLVISTKEMISNSQQKQSEKTSCKD